MATKYICPHNNDLERKLLESRLHPKKMTDYYQGVVRDYLEADFATLVHEEYQIDLDAHGAHRPNTKGRHWHVDILAVNLREKEVRLCEVTYARDLHALILRLEAWAKAWPDLCAALRRNAHLDPEWPIRPCVFIPQQSAIVYQQKKSRWPTVAGPNAMPEPEVNYLEDIVPWKKPEWKKKLEIEAEREPAAD